MKRSGQQNAQRGSGRTVFIAAVLLLCLAVVLFLRVGRWLVHEDPLNKSTAIVLLSGAMPERAVQAAELYRAGYAPEVWITQATEPKRSMSKIGVPFEGEEENSRRVLLHQGVPDKAIHILTPSIVNTADELGVVAGSLQRAKGATVMVVTSKAHTRRVRALWDHLEAGRGQIIIRAAETDPFDAAHWWRSTHDALDVVREVLGLFNAWAGLPLK